MMKLKDDDNKEPFTKDTFIAALKVLHIGEWRRRYSTKRFGYTVCDGTQWELEFEYKNGHRPVRFDGDNSYPYNFDKFQMLWLHGKHFFLMILQDISANNVA
jgi:hypothetical protein